MIQVKNIPPQVIEFFDPEGKSIGFLNEFECLDLRTQIAQQKVAGYYLMYEGRKIMINTDGRLEVWPVGVYDFLENRMADLFTAQRRQL